MSLGYKIKLSDEDLVFLNSIYRVRYPSDAGLLPFSEPNREDSEKALNIANSFIKQIKSLICES